MGNKQRAAQINGAFIDNRKQLIRSNKTANAQVHIPMNDFVMDVYSLMVHGFIGSQYEYVNDKLVLSLSQRLVIKGNV